MWIASLHACHQKHRKHLDTPPAAQHTSISPRRRPRSSATCDSASVSGLDDDKEEARRASQHVAKDVSLAKEYVSPSAAHWENCALSMFRFR